MTVSLTTSNRSAYFNVNPPGDETALFVGCPARATSSKALFPTAGDYTIRVYLMRNAARRDESAITR